MLKKKVEIRCFDRYVDHCTSEFVNPGFLGGHCQPEFTVKCNSKGQVMTEKVIYMEFTMAFISGLPKVPRLQLHPQTWSQGG